MAQLNIPPTKSNLLRLKYDLNFAREGYEMLEQKRQILVLELMDTVGSARLVQEEVRQKMAAAYETLREALIRTGSLKMTADTQTPQPEHSAQVDSRPVMGIYLPTVKAEHPPAGPGASLLSGSATMDEVNAAFRNALEAIDRLAEVENSVFRLAREVRKTLRRVNALEKIFIPAYQEEVAYIMSVLEERERDEFVIMRMVKERVEKSRRSPRPAPG